MDKAVDEISKPDSKSADSDLRFQMLFVRLSKPKRSTKPLAIKNKNGCVIAEVKGRAVTLSKETPEGFTDYLADELPKLMAKFEKQNE